ADLVSQTLTSLSTTFEAKVTDLLTDGTQVIFNNLIKPRLRPILSDAFRDIEYQPSSDSAPLTTYSSDYDYDSENDQHASHPTAHDHSDPPQELVRPRFHRSWTDLLAPFSRLLTPTSFDRLLTTTLSYLARLLEKRLWAYQGRVNPLGATRLERDISGIASAAVDIPAPGSGSGSSGSAGVVGRYRHREVFARCLQIVLVMGMDEEEWEDVVR
ncbi:hypothetical protein COL922a_013966, partial [Colletotrichum nupharicola]